VDRRRHEIGELGGVVSMKIERRRDEQDLGDPLGEFLGLLRVAVQVVGANDLDGNGVVSVGAQEVDDQSTRKLGKGLRVVSSELVVPGKVKDRAVMLEASVETIGLDAQPLEIGEGLVSQSKERVRAASSTSDGLGAHVVDLLETVSCVLELLRRPPEKACPLRSIETGHLVDAVKEAFLREGKAFSFATSRGPRMKKRLEWAGIAGLNVNA